MKRDDRTTEQIKADFIRVTKDAFGEEGAKEVFATIRRVAREELENLGKKGR